MRFTAEIASSWNAKFHPGVHEGVDGRTDVRTTFSELKFLGCIDNQIFLPMVLRFAHARAPLKTNRFHVDSGVGAGFFRAKESKKRQKRDKGGLHAHNYTEFSRVVGYRSYRLWFIRPVSNVALLPCRTQMNLTRSRTAIARQWFQTSNLIQSHQIQNIENVTVRHRWVKTLKIYISYFMNWVRHGNSGTFETEPCHCRVARQTLSNLITVSNLIQVAELNGFKRRATAVPNSINWVRHGSGTTFWNRS